MIIKRVPGQTGGSAFHFIWVSRENHIVFWLKLCHINHTLLLLIYWSTHPSEPNHLNILMILADGSYSISSTTFSSFKSGKQSSASLHWLQCSMTFSWQEDKNSWSDCVSEDLWDLISSSDKDGDKSWNQSQIQASYLTLVLKDLFTIKWKICHYLLSRCSKPIRFFFLPWRIKEEICTGYKWKWTETAAFKLYKDANAL